MSSPSWLRLAGRVAVVTGAGSGIGATISYSLASQGCHVVLADKSLDKASAVAKLCSAAQQDDVPRCEVPTRQLITEAAQCNVCNTSEVKKLIEKADTLARKIKEDDDGTCPNTLNLDSPLASILVNCAGITRDNLIENMTEDEFDDVIAVNLKGTFLTSKYFAAPERLEALGSCSFSSSIINFSSIVGDRGNIGQTNYAASKAGVLGLTKSLAKELARHNIRVNAIVPGFIDTPMTAKMPEHIKERMKQNIPMRRYGTTDNVADLVAFLASERAAYITGESIEISGAISI
eukprot:CAMPEP_0195519618 /NCGR_PEP_ID=MMETSP0794_2-20130614/15141_1 /TAXON_ID=515487 /ORGANISM="Stephanopyxis turris, Strain CCMP 815" /LENGTH=290 /DNA_ID=CAMNT_0040648801 /DNA_START=23 /DNA_END=895 /DNA_ORIENTATION=+